MKVLLTISPSLLKGRVGMSSINYTLAHPNNFYTIDLKRYLCDGLRSQGSD